MRSLRGSIVFAVAASALLMAQALADAPASGLAGAAASAPGSAPAAGDPAGSAGIPAPPGLARAAEMLGFVAGGAATTCNTYRVPAGDLASPPEGLANAPDLGTALEEMLPGSVLPALDLAPSVPYAAGCQYRGCSCVFPPIFVGLYCAACCQQGTPVCICNWVHLTAQCGCV